MELPKWHTRRRCWPVRLGACAHWYSLCSKVDRAFERRPAGGAASSDVRPIGRLGGSLHALTGPGSWASDTGTVDRRKWPTALQVCADASAVRRLGLLLNPPFIIVCFWFVVEWWKAVASFFLFNFQNA